LVTVFQSLSASLSRYRFRLGETRTPTVLIGLPGLPVSEITNVATHLPRFRSSSNSLIFIAAKTSFLQASQYRRLGSLVSLSDVHFLGQLNSNSQLSTEKPSRGISTKISNVGEFLKSRSHIGFTSPS